jgi:polysaccharide biosynthesis protein PslH
MKVVVLSLADPWFEPHGGTLRTRALTAALAELGHDVVVVFPTDSHEQSFRVDLRDGSYATPPVGVRVIPVTGNTFGTRAWPAWVKRIKRILLPMPTRVGSHSLALAAALRELGPVNLLVVSTLPFANYHKELPDAHLWVDHSDLYSDVVAREAARRTRLAKVTAQLQHRAVARTENRLTAVTAMTTAAGYADARVLAARTGASVSWLATPVTFHEVTRVRSSSPVAGFFANFNYWPNVDAFELLQTRWAPQLTAMGWTVLVAGLASEQLDGSQGIRIVGPVESPEDFYREVDVTLAPIRVGGGMKVKVVESFAHGRPVIATAFAMAGFPDNIAAYAHVVDANDPDFSLLAAGPPILAPAVRQHLEPFSAAGFRERVAQLIELLDVPSTSSDVIR